MPFTHILASTRRQNVSRLAATARAASDIAKVARNDRSIRLAYSIKDECIETLVRLDAAYIGPDTRSNAPVGFQTAFINLGQRYTRLHYKVR